MRVVVILSVAHSDISRTCTLSSVCAMLSAFGGGKMAVKPKLSVN